MNEIYSSGKNKFQDHPSTRPLTYLKNQKNYGLKYQPIFLHCKLYLMA